MRQIAALLYYVSYATDFILVPPGQTQNLSITFIQPRPNVFDVGPTLHKCYTNVVCLLTPIITNLSRHVDLDSLMNNLVIIKCDDEVFAL